MQMASFSGSGPLIKMIHVLAISCFKNRILLEINNKKTLEDLCFNSAVPRHSILQSHLQTPRYLSYYKSPTSVMRTGSVSQFIPFLSNGSLIISNFEKCYKVLMADVEFRSLHKMI